MAETANRSVNDNTTAEMMVDVDLSILGQDEKRFTEYEVGIFMGAAKCFQREAGGDSSAVFGSGAKLFDETFCEQVWVAGAGEFGKIHYPITHGHWALNSSPTNLMETDSNRQPELIDLSQIEGVFSFEEGFHRPDWKVIAQLIQQSVAGSDDLDAAWTEAAAQWVDRVREDLGGDYQARQSGHFILLSDLDEEPNSQLLSFAERTLKGIRERLGGAAWITGHGKHVILLFAEDDDYYQYVSYFHRDGTHPTSGGCLLRKGYIHIAAPYEPSRVRRMLAHELLHNCVAHLRLPLWLNEGLAVMFERSVEISNQPVLDAELKLRHLDFWNEKNIQEFWSGISWQRPGDSNHLSYSLAEIMVILLSERRGDWGGFLRQAQVEDAGQTAALDCLGVDLGGLIATFLGEGNWRPRRKAIRELWEAWQKRGA